MIDAATLEMRMRSGQLGVIADAYLHRATRETTLAVLWGRDALLAAAVAEAAAFPDATTTLGFCADDLATFVRQCGTHRWHGHRWLDREGERIVHETLIEDGRNLDLVADSPAATSGLTPLHRPLGELRPGRGQFTAGDTAIVPPGWPEAARPVANALHRVWNGKAVDHIETLWHPDVVWAGPAGAGGGRGALAQWLMALFASLPDATLLFERAIVGDGTVAILWRLHGHHRGGHGFGPAAGRRVRLIGSSVLRIEAGLIVADETVFDSSAIALQLTAPIIAWRAIAAEGVLDGDGG